MQEIQLEKKRVGTIDLLRGLIMIIMALDHTRDFFHTGALQADPLNPDTTTPILYFTRWITHFCAPTFVFLSGVSAWLQAQRKSKKELSLFLVKRGLWLILVDLTIMSFAFTADIHFNLFTLETLWSIGMGMIVLGVVIWLPFYVILSAGLLIVLGHNLIDFAEKGRNAVPVTWSLVHRVAIVPLGGGRQLLILYPFLSWAGLMMLGYCAGRLFTSMSFNQRKKILTGLGIAAVCVFVVLRFINVYGDPGPWSKRETGLQTFFAFMNVQKYPPSLLFLCATIGPVLLFLAFVKEKTSRLRDIISVYGRVPLFYFIVHFYLLHLAEIIAYLSRRHSLAEGAEGVPGIFFKFAVPGEGYPLWIVYLIWIATVIAMYPICKWYDNYKQKHKEKRWLSYL